MGAYRDYPRTVGGQTSVVAVIPTFCPTEGLLELARIVTKTVDGLVISDDASKCTADALLHEASLIPDVHVVRHRTNEGIARGLNDGLALARSHQAKWLLTFDQDTMVRDSYVCSLVDMADQRFRAGERLGALGAEVIQDWGGAMRYPTRRIGGFLCTEELIQTGTLWSVTALEQVGRFDESLGMDAVDAAACLALRQAGFTIGVATDLTLDHRIGNSRLVRLGARSMMVTGHSPERRSSMLRNRLRLFPAEFSQSPRHAFRTIRRVGVNQSLGLLLEHNRWEKAKGTIRGIRPPQYR